MRRFRLDVSRKTGMTTLWMSTEQSPCGYTPLIGWSDISGLREFADMLLDMYHHNLRQTEKIKKTSDNILKQVFTNTPIGEGATDED